MLFCPVDKMGKLIEDIEYLSTCESETVRAKVWAATVVLICLVDCIIGERKQQAFNTEQNITEQEIQNVVFLNIHRND